MMPNTLKVFNTISQETNNTLKKRSDLSVVIQIIGTSFLLIYLII